MSLSPDNEPSKFLAKPLPPLEAYYLRVKQNLWHRLFSIACRFALAYAFLALSSSDANGAVTRFPRDSASIRCL